MVKKKLLRDSIHTKHRRNVRNWRKPHEDKGQVYRKVDGRWRWVRKIEQHHKWH